MQPGVNSSTPIPVVDSSQAQIPIVQVSAGVRHSCGVTLPGVVWCWGSNANGQLATGVTGANTAGGVVQPPRVVVGVPALQSVAAGGTHSCGVTAGGMVYCWGNNADGQLGTGAVASGSALPPAAVPGLSGVTQVVAGLRHSCALQTGGLAVCWGYNEYGQIGRIDASSSGSPILVAGNHRFASLTAGWRHSCGVVAAGAVDEGAWCWGGNLYGALGNQLQAAARGTPVKADPLR